MDIHVLTPFSRPQNLARLLRADEPEDITWHLIATAEQAPDSR